MNRKNAIILIVSIIILVMGSLVFWYLSSNKTPVTPTASENTASNPFGNTSINKPTVPTDQTPVDQNTKTTQTASQLMQLYGKPTSGVYFSINKSNQPLLRFVDRAVGNIYEYLPVSQTGSVVRITNTTIPKIQESFWGNSGNNVIFRYLEDDTDNISSFSAKIIISSSSVNLLGDLVGNFLSSNIKQIAINPKGDKVFGLVDKSDKSGVYGFTTNLDGSSKKMIFDSPILYWNISWPKENIIALTTKPNFSDPGLLYFFNFQTYSMDRILGNITGLSTTINKDASLIAYSYSLSNSFMLDVYDVINKITKNIKIPTLAEKCVWGNGNSKILYCAVPKYITPGSYPDVWYQGLQSFSDNIWKIDTDTGAAEELYEIGTNETANIDAINLSISFDDKYLSFMNKKDLSLWLLNTVSQ